MKPKAKTLIEKSGFLDPDRKNPLHDEMQVWVFNNAETILRDLNLLNPSNKVTFSNQQLEFPVKNKDYIVGFIDSVLQLDYTRPVQCVKYVDFATKFVGAGRWEKLSHKITYHTTFDELKERNLDVNEYMASKEGAEIVTVDRGAKMYVAFEFKSSIPSLGDVIRQVNFYKQYHQSHVWIIVSPDDQHAEILYSQNIRLYRYKRPNQLF